MGIVRKHTSEAAPSLVKAAPPTSTSGQPVASKVKATDFDVEEAFGASKPNPVVQPVAAVSENCAEDTASNVVAAAAAAPPMAPAKSPKESDKQVDFDFDFD